MSSERTRAGLRSSIFVRVLTIVLAAGLVVLGLAAFASVNVVRDHLEAQLVDAAVLRAQEISTKVDHSIELGRAELHNVALLVEAGRPLEVPNILSSSTLALECRRGDDVLFEAATTEGGTELLRRNTTSEPGSVQVVDGDKLYIVVETGELQTRALIDVAQLEGAAEGWTISFENSPEESTSSHEDPGVIEQIDAGGTLARRETDSNGDEFVNVLTSSRNEVVVAVRAPLAPARNVSFSVMKRIVVWSSVVVLPLLILAWLLARAVTSPVRSLATAVRQAHGEVVQLPPLPRDEIGDLGNAIGAMSERLSEDARALRTAVEFARRVNLLRDESDVFEALETALCAGIPSVEWAALSRSKIEDEDVGELAGVPVEILTVLLETDAEEIGGGRARDETTNESILRASGQRGIVDTEGAIATEGDEELLHLVLRHGESIFGIVVGRRVPKTAVGHAELLCRAASAALRNLELFRSVLSNEKLVVLGRVVAGVAHEVNNPLAFVLANLRAVEEEVTGHLREAVVEAREGAERMGRIISDLSTLSRGGMQVSIVKSDLAEVVHEAARMAKARYPDGNIVVEARSPSLIRGDPDRLVQVLANLIINGLEASSGREDQRVEVRVKVTNELATVEVEDNGEVIPKSAVPRLFDAFFTTKGEHGTGLGLFISRSLVQAHGGDLMLLRSEDESTVFRLELPQAFGLHDTFTPVPFSKISSLGPSDQRTRPSILVVDDEIALVRALRRWLGRWAEVTGTNDPQEGLDLASGGDFDLVLCDIDMPKMSGQEFIRSLGERSSGMRQKVVLMTGSSSGEVEGVTVLRKPLDEEILKKLVYGGLSRSRDST